MPPNCKIKSNNDGTLNQISHFANFNLCNNMLGIKISFLLTGTKVAELKETHINQRQNYQNVTDLNLPLQFFLILKVFYPIYKKRKVIMIN